MNVIIVSILEVVLVGFTVWCLFNENKLIAFERKVMRKVRCRKLKVIKGGKGAAKFYA